MWTLARGAGFKSKEIRHNELGKRTKIMNSYFKQVELKTHQNNLLDLEPKLAPYLEDVDFFSITDFTDDSHQWVLESKIQNGLLTVQSMHTTCVVSMNELDEPCLLGDLTVQLRESVPKTKSYLHNSGIRTKNLCEDDDKCDRNADAHIKASLYGSASQTVIIRDGKPLFGKWQRLCFIDFDGPRDRRVMVQIIGS